MIVTVASYKGGVGKTTTAVHLARYLQGLGPALLLDGDATKNATAWAQRGKGKPGEFPFAVEPVAAAAMLVGRYAHTVIDTGQRPSDDDLAAAAKFSDLLVIPTVVSALDSDGLGQTIRALQKIGATNWAVLLTRVPADAAKDAAELRLLLGKMKARVFRAEIPRLKAFDKAADAGCTVDQVDDRNAARGWLAYEAVGRELRSVMDASRERTKR